MSAGVMRGGRGVGSTWDRQNTDVGEYDMTDADNGVMPENRDGCKPSAIEETEALLRRCASRVALADKIEITAVRLAESGNIAASADHFAVAAGLRGRARIIP